MMAKQSKRILILPCNKLALYCCLGIAKTA